VLVANRADIPEATHELRKTAAANAADSVARFFNIPPLRGPEMIPVREVGGQNFRIATSRLRVISRAR
jgi:hypothetical protein